MIRDSRTNGCMGYLQDQILKISRPLLAMLNSNFHFGVSVTVNFRSVVVFGCLVALMNGPSRLVD
jgi:hypothetical protein